MGCLQSHHSNPQLHNHKDNAASSSNDAEDAGAFAPVFSELSLTDLKAPTNSFSIGHIVSEGGDKSPNVVYEGRLENHNGRWIAVKRFSKLAWPDPKQFAAEARSVGKLRHSGLANLIGYCCEGDERLLVAEYMPNRTLTKHLFHSENHTIDWSMRSRVALSIAEALDYCCNKGYQLSAKLWVTSFPSSFTSPSFTSPSSHHLPSSFCFFSHSRESLFLLSSSSFFSIQIQYSQN